MPVQTWEYSVVVGYSDGRVFVNGEEQSRDKLAHDVLNELGVLGWELAGQSEAVGAAGGDITYTLRRPHYFDRERSNEWMSREEADEGESGE